MTRTPSPEHVRVRIPHTPDSFDQGIGSPTTPLSGYDLVADKLAAGELPPTFRSFKRIKFRLLLQLQDEILEMEQQLAALDGADTQSRLNSDGSTSPASRRFSWQWSQSELPTHRLHILGRLSMKLEQYCTAKHFLRQTDDADCWQIKSSQHLRKCKGFLRRPHQQISKSFEPG